jgi:hypothetical protein
MGHATETPTVLMAKISAKENELHKILGRAAAVSEELKNLFLEAQEELKKN